MTVAFVDKSLTFHLYRIHKIPLLQPIIKKSFQYEIEHRHFAIRSDLHYITFPDDENVLSFVVSSYHLCRLNTALHPVDKIQECSYFLFDGDEENIRKYCQISFLNQTRDHTISIDENFWPITSLNPRNLYISILIYSYPLSL